MPKIANTSTPETSPEGYLTNRDDWNRSVAEAIASQEKLNLTQDHWDTIFVLREFYNTYELHPALRILIKKLAEKWGKEKANSIYLHQLFPEGPIKQASKIAGLPKPLKCL